MKKEKDLIKEAVSCITDLLADTDILELSVTSSLPLEVTNRIIAGALVDIPGVIIRAGNTIKIYNRRTSN